MKYILIYTITLVYFSEVAHTGLRIDIKEINEQSEAIHTSTSPATPGGKLEAIDTRRDRRKKKRKPSKSLKTDLDTLEDNVRPLQEGDTLTPRELLPVAKKLMEKAKKFAYVFGLLAKNNKPEILADKLFERFFQNSKRIVNIKDTDIDDLDSLQALALNGEAGANITRIDNSRTTLKGEKHKNPKSCKFSLLSKRLKKKPELQNGVIHRVDSSPETQMLRVHADTKDLLTAKGNLTKQLSKPACRWEYICEDPRDIDTCRLHTRCNRVVDPNINRPSQPPRDEIQPHRKSAEGKALRQRFKKNSSKQAVSNQQLMEILYGRSLKLNRNGTDIESLGEYFNKLLQREYDESKRNKNLLKKYGDISVTTTSSSEETYTDEWEWYT